MKKTERPTCIIPLPDCESIFTFTEQFPFYLYPINKYLNLLQYSVALMSQIQCREIWIIANKSIIPFLKESIGEQCKYLHINYRPGQRSDHKYRVRHIPIYYIAPLRDDIALSRREPLWQFIRTAITIRNFNKKFSFRQVGNKYIYFNIKYFFPLDDCWNAFNDLKRKKNINIEFYNIVRNKKYDFFSKKSMFFMLDYNQILKLKQTYLSIKKLNKKIKDYELKMAINKESFTSKISIQMDRIYTIYDHRTYLNFIQYYRKNNKYSALLSKDNKVFWRNKNQTVKRLFVKNNTGIKKVLKPKWWKNK